MTEHALKRFQVSLLTGLLAGGLVMGTGVALAQDEERKTKQTVAMSQQVYEALVEIQTMVEETKDYAGAEAAARERAQIATVQADKNIVEEQNQLRVRTAELEAIAKAKEEEASVAGDIARATAEQELEQQRIELERRRLEADVVTPAKANLEAKQLAAQAEAAKIIEDGKAQVEVFQRLTEQYQAAGDDGQRIFVLNMLPELVDKIVSTVNNVDIDRVAIVDNGGGQGGGIPGLVSQLPGAVVSLTEQIEAATGVDILGSMRSDQADSEPDSELPPPPPAPEA